MKRHYLFACIVCLCMLLFSSVHGSMISEEVIVNNVGSSNDQQHRELKDDVCFTCQFRPICLYLAYMIYYYDLAAEMFIDYPLIYDYITSLVDGYELFYYDVFHC